MPEISRFFGIVIRMYYDEHLPPHFHAEYGEHHALVDINTLAVMFSSLSPRALGLVMEWAALHQEELRTQWDRARNLQPLGRIAPLQ